MLLCRVVRPPLSLWCPAAALSLHMAAASTATTLPFRGAHLPVTFDTPECEERWPVVLQSVNFQAWLDKMEKTPFSMHSLRLQSVDMFGSRLGFVKFQADVRRPDGSPIPGIVFLRGGSVVILVILECEGKEYALTTVQARIPVGQASSVEIPAGMLDQSGNFSGVAAHEMEEETGLIIHQDELVDLTLLAYGDQEGEDPVVYPSMGGCDEFQRFFLFRKQVTAQELADMEGRMHGCEGEHEQISLKLVPYENLWRETRALGAHGCILLYEKLRAEGKLP